VEPSALIEDGAVRQGLDHHDLVGMPLDRMAGEGEEVLQGERAADDLAQIHGQARARDDGHLGARPSQMVPAVHGFLERGGYLIHHLVRFLFCHEGGS
jgi:hypothetical protein